MLLTVIWIGRSGALPGYRNFYLGCCYWRALCTPGCGKAYSTKPMVHVYNIVISMQFYRCVHAGSLPWCCQPRIDLQRERSDLSFPHHHSSRLPAPPVLCAPPPGANWGLTPKRPGIHPGGWAQSRLLKLSAQWALIN